MAEEIAVEQPVADIEMQNTTEDPTIENTTTTEDPSTEKATGNEDATSKDVKKAASEDSTSKDVKKADNDAGDKKESSRLHDFYKNDRPDAYNYMRTNSLNRSSYAKLEDSNDQAEIRKQVEFYFSDSNLPTDAYLLRLTGAHENKPVPLKTIHDFKRMRHFQPFSALREAVEASNFLDLSDKNEITRKTPLDSKFTQDVKKNSDLMYDVSIARSIYAKGFGDEYSTLQLDIENFFKPYGPFNSVRMRRQNTGQFKGSVFVEFATEDLAKQFLDLQEKPRWYITSHQEKADDADEMAADDDKEEKAAAEGEKAAADGEEAAAEGEKAAADGEKAAADGEDKPTAAKEAVELQIMSKISYVEDKTEGIRNGTIQPSEQRYSSRGNYRGRGRGRGNNSSRGSRRDRDVDRDDWKERRNRDQRRDPLAKDDTRDRRSSGRGKKRDNRGSREAIDIDVKEPADGEIANRTDAKKQKLESVKVKEESTSNNKRSRDEAEAGAEQTDAKKQKANEE